jgi:hypothetical protein
VDHANDDDQATQSPDTHHARGAGEASGAPAGRETDVRQANASIRVKQTVEHRAAVDADHRRYVIDHGYERIREIEEKVVTPAMRRIEAEDPERRLAGLENRLKGKERLAEKVLSHMKSNPELTCDQALAKVKDTIRYTFVYGEEHYTEGVRTDIARLEDRFELVDLRNTWPTEEYKGINSRWLVSGSQQIFEVQFHTQASFDAKQLTHIAYEKIRNPATPKGERDDLQSFQRKVSADIPVPRDVNEILNNPGGHYGNEDHVLRNRG